MLRWLKLAAGGLLLLALLALVAGRLSLLRGTPPTDLGVRDGRFKPPSSTPNSVSSQARLWPGHLQGDHADIAPLALKGDGTATLARLAELVAATPGGQVVESRPGYLRAEFSTRWLGFTDDTEFWFDPTAGAVQVRSASRLGRRDFDVNRQRVEQLRAQLAAG